MEGLEPVVPEGVADCDGFEELEREGEGMGAAVGVGSGGRGLGRSAFRGHVWVAGGSADHGLFVFSVGVCGFESWGFRV